MTDLRWRCTHCRDQGFVHDGTYDMAGERNTMFCPSCEQIPKGWLSRPDTLDGLQQREAKLKIELKEVRAKIRRKKKGCKKVIEKQS